MFLWSVEGNAQSLDGGSMFGNAPRALWQEWMAPDEHNRIRLACRGLLATGLNGQTVLFEAGVGAFFEPDLRARYGIEGDTNALIDALAACGVGEHDVDAVVLSHLHFDHAGGLLSDWREGREPELRFPRATYFVGADAWERACRPHARDRASFVPELQRRLDESGRLQLIDDARSARFGGAVEFRFSHGHTPGLMLSIIGGDGGVAFCSDLIPGRAWMHLPITMGFDRYPERVVDEKEAFLNDMLARNIRLVFTHDPVCAMASVARDEKGRFVAVDEHASLAGMELKS